MFEMPPQSVMPPQSMPPQSTIMPEATKRKSFVEAYSVGNRVYNGGAPSPHVGGGLDPTGYQERDALARTAKTNAIKNMSRGGM